LRAFAVLAFLIVALPLHAAPPETKVPAAGPGHAAIASAYPLASEAGKQILAKGGNAFDAAVAVASALAVVESCCSGLGGGGFFLLRRARDGHESMIDLREMAPGASTRDMYLDKDGNVVPGLSRWRREFRESRLASPTWRRNTASCRWPSAWRPRSSSRAKAFRCTSACVAP
jgi:hypothetical protein